MVWNIGRREIQNYLPKIGVTGLSSTEEPMEGGEPDGEHTLEWWSWDGALEFKLDANVVTTWKQNSWVISYSRYDISNESISVLLKWCLNDYYSLVLTYVAGMS